LKCYVHRDFDAIGVCHECGQGVCDACAVRIGGKLYCKEDADRVFSPLKEEAEQAQIEPMERPMRFSVSSVLTILYGLFGIGLAILFLAAGFATGFVSSVPSLDSWALASVGLLALGGLFLVMGILGVISGIWLWSSKILGIYSGIPLLVIGCIVAIALGSSVQTLATWEISGTILAVNITLLTLLFGCWHKLRPDLF
jgi:hypothetical protein